MIKIKLPLKIKSTGPYVPSIVVKNADLIKDIDTTEEWIEKKLGIKERRFTTSHECTSDLASKAGLKAINQANLKVDDIDLIIVATATPDRIAPSTACIVQEKIKAFNAAAFDISAVCSGFLFGFSIASQYINFGTYKNILLIGADCFSKITDFNSSDAVFFGDGAGAVIMSPSEDSGILSVKIYSDGRGKDNFTVLGGGSETPLNEKNINDKLNFFSMIGKNVYDTATTVLPKAINEALQESNLSIDDIDLLIPHQPSIKTLIKTAEKIGLPWSKVMTNMDLYANTAGATVPLLLDQVFRAGKIKKDDKILFAAVGSGWTYAVAIMQW